MTRVGGSQKQKTRSFEERLNAAYEEEDSQRGRVESSDRFLVLCGSIAALSDVEPGHSEVVTCEYFHTHAES